ncbi:lytic murein transglycosylase [Hydrogenophaga sp. BPS33]|uniref:lytic murein transglycosylase n=1 Tax=Hydrogenophaga sp. BPS33 TaxID=2651974 RepID=UPI00131F7AF2|nr:lytic murein transglycosylase [Hydrogenophaga sp. BPS33]QHE88846.1 lytic murein transglycosylase [Hydrogenophaga sp. BPS33]
MTARLRALPPLTALLATLLAVSVWAQNPPPPTPAPPPGEFDSCLAKLRAPARAVGVNDASFTRFTQGLQPDMSVIDKLNYQPEFRTAVWDYLAGLVDDQRVAEGQGMLALHAETLKRVQERYGVDPATVVAVWGVESNFGQTFGKSPLVQSLGTLSCFGRRQGYFRTELFAALRILQEGHIARERLVGSWAGAFGHTQFMPSTFERLAVDFDGDGKADLMDSAADALASTANFLHKAGWQSNQPWGFEVRLPRGFNSSGEGRRTKRPMSEWAERGVTHTDGSPLPSGMGVAGLLTPAGPQGPAFLVLRNFDAIYGYNASESYGLAIAHLSDRLRGGGAFATPWPTDDPGLSRAERREVQTLLIARGHDIGEVDGMLGDKSRAAIRAEQERLGQEASGRAGQKLLKSLRGL